MFYPKDGGKSFKKTDGDTKGDNNSVIGIRGNFDDAQTGVKIFANTKLSDKMRRRVIAFLLPTL